MRFWIIVSILFLILMTLILISCCAIKQNTDCTNLSIQELQIILNNDSINDIIKNISQIFNISIDEILIKQEDQYLELTWQNENRTYKMSIENNQRVITIFFDKKQPIAKDLIMCFGNPEWYTTGYGPIHEMWMFNLEMYFPELGLIAHSFKYFRSDQKNLTIDENITISKLRITLSGSIEDVISYLYYDAPDVAEMVLLRLKPWPGNWQDIVIEIDPSIRP